MDKHQSNRTYCKISQELATTPVLEGQKLENWGGLCSVPLEALRPAGLKVAFYNVPNLMQMCKDNKLSCIKFGISEI